jgi:NTP pyrophosphatase (non-canonical NTP hydrolase)
MNERNEAGAVVLGDFSQGVAALSLWIDEGNVSRHPEAATWARLSKITEEAGEVVAAYIGATGQNPRKGITHTIGDVEEELLDVALTALAALEHLRGHDARSGCLLAEKLTRTLERAGLLS